MRPESRNLPEVVELVSRLCDNGLGRDGFARLEQLLLADRDCLRFYVEYLDEHGELQSRVRPREAWLYDDDSPMFADDGSEQPVVAKPADARRQVEVSLGETIGAAAHLPRGDGPQQQASSSGQVQTIVVHIPALGDGRWIPHSRAFWLFVGTVVNLAAVVLVMLLLQPYRRNADVREQLGAIVAVQPEKAVVEHSHEVRWATNSHQLFERDKVNYREPISIESGILGLRLASGVELSIQGPAEWTVDEFNRATLKSGRLRAKVPKQAIGFALMTPRLEIVDLGTEFCVEVTSGAGTDLSVLTGLVAAKLVDERTASGRREAFQVAAGRSISVSSQGEKLVWTSLKPSLNELADYKGSSSTPQRAVFNGTVPLGNLFDDRARTSLAEAVSTDTMRAVPDSDHLGIESVLIGPGTRRAIGPNLIFDFAGIGWTGAYSDPVTNDASVPELTDPHYWTIRTEGQHGGSLSPSKVEDGIGLHPDQAIVFNLDEIRAAGNLTGMRLRFVCDRAGINDRMLASPDRNTIAVNLLVMVSEPHRVVSANLNGASVAPQTAGKVWSVAPFDALPLKADGRMVSIELSIPPTARYLTLATAGLAKHENTIHACHAVLSGARLEVAGK